MQEEDERALVDRAKRDPEAFGILYQRYLTPIYNYHYRHTGSTLEAEDLTSRTFYRALRSLEHYRDLGASFQAWLFRIAHNLLANWHRDRSRHPEFPMDAPEELVPGGGDPERELEVREEHESLLQALRRLPEDRFNLVVLKVTTQMSNARIGELLGRTEGAIKSLYHRTLKSLREMLPGIVLEEDGE